MAAGPEHVVHVASSCPRTMHMLENLIRNNEVKTLRQHVLANIECRKVDGSIGFEAYFFPIVTGGDLECVETIGAECGNPIITLPVRDYANPVSRVKPDPRQQITQHFSIEAAKYCGAQRAC